MKYKNYLFSLFVILIFSGLIIFLELYLRHSKPIINQSDELLGWKLLPNLNLEFNQKNILREEYKVSFKTNKRGSRFYGDEKNSELKILVMGDSMTNGPYASNNDTWFSVFAKNLETKYNKKVYVESIGSGGYGNFQQYLLAKKVRNYINPDFVILQFCHNDFYNNTYEWESKGVTRNQFIRRPYLINEKIYYHKGILKYLYNSKLFENVRLINRVDLFISLLQSIIFNVTNVQVGMNDSSQNIETLNLKKKSVKNTNLILSKLKKEFHDVDLFIFNMCGIVKSDSGMIEANNYPFNTWQELSINNDLIPLNFLKNINFKEESFYKDAGHFSGIGNTHIGNELFNHFLKLDKVK